MNHLGGEPSEKQLGNRKPSADFVNILGSELYIILLIYPHSRRQISLQQDFFTPKKKKKNLKSEDGCIIHGSSEADIPTVIQSFCKTVFRILCTGEEKRLNLKHLSASVHQ